MAKQSGLGDNFYAGGYDLSGDVNSVGKISGGPALLDFTTINKFANVRQGGLRSGEVDITTFFESGTGGVSPSGVAGLATLPRTDEIMTYTRGTTLGNPSASCFARQLNYDPTRGTDGSLTIGITGQSDGYGLEWGIQLTPGLRTDTTATPGPASNFGTATTFGSQAYLHVTAFSGTSVDVKVEHSSDNTSWATLIDFGSQSAIGASRGTSTSTVNQYVRATTGTGTFSTITFAVNFVRNTVAVSF